MLTLQAYQEQEIPIACMIKNKITQKSYFFYNKKESTNCILGHAEIEAIKHASKITNDFRLDNWEIIITTEPCIMCLGALLESRISKITILSKKQKNELWMCEDYIKTKKTIIQYNLDPYFEKIVKNFFQKKRNVI